MDRRSFTCGGIASLLAASRSRAQTPFKLTLVRTFESAACTTGELFVGRDFLSHTLELPWQDNRSYVSSIPSKEYRGELRYDKKDHWRIQLNADDTYPRTGIQIHIANEAGQLQGCVALGLEVENFKPFLAKSAEAYNLFKQAFYGAADPVSSPNKVIRLNVVYNVAPTEFVARDEEAGTEARYRQDGTAWLLFSDAVRGRHVWNELRRTTSHVYFKGIPGSGVWDGRFIRVPLHGGSAMEISEDSMSWDEFAENVKITRRDGTTSI